MTRLSIACIVFASWLFTPPVVAVLFTVVVVVVAALYSACRDDDEYVSDVGRYNPGERDAESRNPHLAGDPPDVARSQTGRDRDGPDR